MAFPWIQFLQLVIPQQLLKAGAQLDPLHTYARIKRSMVCYAPLDFQASQVAGQNHLVFSKSHANQGTHNGPCPI
jgi:hypothetical protein